MLYALSTCSWCHEAKRLLNELGVEYNYEDADLLEGAARRDVMADVERWNPRRTFPTLVADNSHCIVGFKEAELRNLLKA